MGLCNISLTKYIIKKSTAKRTSKGTEIAQTGGGTEGRRRKVYTKGGDLMLGRALSSVRRPSVVVRRRRPSRRRRPVVVRPSSPVVVRPVRRPSSSVLCRRPYVVVVCPRSVVRRASVRRPSRLSVCSPSSSVPSSVVRRPSSVRRPSRHRPSVVRHRRLSVRPSSSVVVRPSSVVVRRRPSSSVRPSPPHLGKVSPWCTPPYDMYHMVYKQLSTPSRGVPRAAVAQRSRSMAEKINRMPAGGGGGESTDIYQWTGLKYRSTCKYTWTRIEYQWNGLESLYESLYPGFVTPPSRS